MTTSKLTLLNLLTEVNKPSFSPEKMIQIISADVSLSYRLLRYINSAYFYLVKKINSISHAVTYLGEDEIRRFVTLAVISEISSNKPAELVRLAAVRAKFCEQVGLKSNRQTDRNELFMLGLFSLLHAMLDSPTSDILKKIPVSDDIKRALIDLDGPLAIFLKTVIAYERGKSEEFFPALGTLHIPVGEVYDIYLSSLEFADSFVNL